MSFLKLESMNNTINEIVKVARELSSERDQLREDLKYANARISQLTEQNQQLKDLRSQAQSPAQLASAVTPGSSLIHGIWFSSPKSTSMLTAVEKAWKDGEDQRALILLHSISKRNDLTSKQEIQTKLLFSAILVQSGFFHLALQYAESAFSMALTEKLHDLVGKAQFHMGHCYLQLEKYTDARACFFHIK